MRKILQYTAVTASGQAYDIAFPLHPATHSGDVVARLVTRLLAGISEHAALTEDLSDGDVLQALAMTTAIRARMLGLQPAAAEALNRSLQETAWEAVQAADSYPAGRA